MKRILVLSDSHSGNSFMRWCVNTVKPDAIIHLGDYYDDGLELHEEYPLIPFYSVPGNCDRYRAPAHAGEILIQPVFGVELYMTHGHKQGVKSSTALMVAEAHAMHAQAALYGHTHVAENYRDETGMWVMNPGSAGYGGGSAGLIETENNTIISCRIITPETLEEFV